MIITYTGWWFGTFVIFPYIWNNYPNWPIFFRGVETTNQYKWWSSLIIIIMNWWSMIIHITNPWSLKIFDFYATGTPPWILWDTPSSATAMSHEELQVNAGFFFAGSELTRGTLLRCWPETLTEALGVHWIRRISRIMDLCKIPSGYD